jgi:hypothetical protein
MNTAIAVVASGGTLSGVIGLRNTAGNVTVLAPVVTSCELRLMGGADAAVLRPVHTAQGSRFAVPIGPGSHPATRAGPVAFCQLDLSVAQTDTRSSRSYRNERRRR